MSLLVHTLVPRSGWGQLSIGANRPNLGRTVPNLLSEPAIPIY